VHVSSALVLANGFDAEATPALLKFVARSGVLVLGTLAGAGTFLVAAKILRLALRGDSPSVGKGEKHAETSRIFTEYRVPPSREVKP
jgi:hypothetical protein